MKHILILTADYGYGHRSAANAIADALQETHGDYCSVEIVNPMDDPSVPVFLRDGENGYDKIVRAAPDLYKLGYDIGDTRVVSSVNIRLMYTTQSRLDMYHQNECGWG